MSDYLWEKNRVHRGPDTDNLYVKAGQYQRHKWCDECQDYVDLNPREGQPFEQNDTETRIAGLIVAGFAGLGVLFLILTMVGQ